jgi:hypothetical protein
MPRWSRPFLISLPLFLLLSLTAAPPAGEAKEEGSARIGAWNIEWLGNAEKRRKPIQKAEDVAAYIAASKVILLALNEVTGDVESNGTYSSSILTEAFKQLSARDGGNWRHLLFPPEKKDERDQLCGVAWHKDWELVDKPFRIPIRRGPKTSDDIWRRHPHAVKFSRGDKKTDVVLIPVHMKSNSGGGVTQRSKVRAEEARLLVRGLATMQNHFQDDDVLILGDLNCLLREEPALAQFRVNGFHDLNGADQLTWIRDRQFDPAPFDRILVPEEQPEFKGCSLTVFREHGLNGEREFRERLSDHYLVHTDIKVMEDDD